MTIDLNKNDMGGLIKRISLKTNKGILCLVFSICFTTAFAQQMQYVSAKAVSLQNRKDLEAVSQLVLQLQVQTKDAYTPLTLLNVALKTIAGKQNAFTNGKVYYTGTKDSFTTDLPFGNLQFKNGQLISIGEQELKSGVNYFWITVEPQAKNKGIIPELNFVSCTTGLQQYRQAWADEFSKDGPPAPANWQHENGFVRNDENQWYQPENAVCKNGILTIEARRDSIPNPRYEEGSRDWRRNRKTIRYTSSSINTRGKQAWTYGRLEMRARLDTNVGCWPAWWCLGVGGGSWPDNGEIDMMEFYRGKILANYAVGTQKQYNAKWFSTVTPLTDFKKQNWTDSFHNWRMDWDSVGIAIYLDDMLLNYQPQSNMYNRNGSNNYYPFRHPQYMLLNFALGGQNGGDPSNTSFPRKYDIDYVRVLQKVAAKFTGITVYTK